MKILLATLTPGSVSAHFHESVCDLLENPIKGIEIKRVSAFGGPRLANQRNIIASHFLNNTEAEKLLFVDSDIKFTAPDLEQLVSSNQDIVGGRCYGYSQERGEVFPNWKPLTGIETKDKIVECSHIGMDFTLISRRTISQLGVRIAEGWPFGYGEINGKYGATEDILFCHRARESGMKIFVNMDARVYHAKICLV